jgi:hypothetical protein
LAHWLLTKFAVDEIGQMKMRYALGRMCNGHNRTIVSSWQYEIVRKARSKALSLHNQGNKYGKGQKVGYVPTAETLAKLSAAGKKAWKEGRFTKRRPNTKGNPGYHHTEEYKKSQSLKHKAWWSTVDPEWLAARGRKISAARKGKTLSEEIRRKISETRKGQPGQKGRRHTEESRRKMSESHKGAIPSKETRLRMSEAQKGRTHSEETRRKIGDGNRGKVYSEETRTRMRFAAKKRWTEGAYVNRKPKSIAPVK